MKFSTTIVPMILVALLLAACGATPTPPPAPTAQLPAPTAVPATATPPPPSPGPVTPTPAATATATTDDDLAKSQGQGFLVVGSSLDNPPYSTYNEQFRPAGFDVAYITEIGRRLNLRTEVNDFTFEGLIDALRLKQVDAAIAAIDITPDRSAVVDFSTPYYMGEDGILAAPGSSIAQVRSLNDFQGRRVGVQRGSVYEAWLTETLVQTGQLPAENLLAYVTPDQAVDDLDAGRVDLVVMDRRPANNFVQQGQAKLVGYGLNPQAFAIAVRKGSNLLPQINQAIRDMVDDGNSAHLIATYLQTPLASIELPTPAPAATAAPTAAAASAPAPAACVEGMAWVADLSMDDKNMSAPPTLQPGQQFTKGWRLRNTGTCDWTPDFALTYRSGNSPLARMGGSNFKIGQTVAPGETIELTVNLVAPQTPGVYQGFWQMANAAGKPLGERVWVGIRVPAPPVSVPPTQTPAPGVSFTVDRGAINAGECANFIWNVTGVRAVYFYAQGQPYQNFGVAGQGSKSVCPTATTVYELRVDRADGNVDTRQIQLNVNAVAGAPVITQFVSTPEYEINAGQCANFIWRADGAISRVALTRDGVALWDYAPVNGSFNDCPPGAGPKDYELQVWGPGGFVKGQRALIVRPAALPPTAVPQPEQPIIASFTATPPQLDPSNNCVALQWQISGPGIAAVSVTRNGLLIAGPDAESGLQDCVPVKDQGKTQVYQLKVDTEFGGSATMDLNVPFPLG
jgi:ABC-type amino acid transport substrate-binding protein